MMRDAKRTMIAVGAGLCAFGSLGFAVGVAHDPPSAPRDQLDASAPGSSEGPTEPELQPEREPEPAPTTTTTSAPVVEVAGVSTIPEDYGCAAALAYLAIHAKPGTVSYCPHYAEGHSAETRLVLAYGVASTEVYIAEPCPAAYKNEASNSWGHWEGRSWIPDYPLDPYGTC
jgi:hypothetical protein